MSTEERNDWLVKHMETMVSTIRRYCYRSPELDFDDTYSEIMEWMIKKLDERGEELIDIPDFKINQIVGNKINSLKKRVKPVEEPCDPSSIELIYDPDFYSNIIPWECDRVIKLKERDRMIFMDYVFSDWPITLNELSKKYSLTQERIRQIILKAIFKLRNQFFLKDGVYKDATLYFCFSGGALIHKNYDYSYVEIEATVKARSSSHARVIISEYIQDALNTDWAPDLRGETISFLSKNKDLMKIEVRYVDK